MDYEQGKAPMDETCRAMLRTISQAREAGLMTARLADYAQHLALGSRACPMSGGRVNGFGVEHFCGKVHKERSTVNRMTRQLERDGWIIVRTPSNGLRGRSHSGRIYGIDLRPLIAREAEVLEAVEQCRAENREGRELRDTLRAEKGRVTRLLAAAEDAGQAERADQAAKMLSSIPRRFTKLTLDELRTMVDAVEQFFDDIEARDHQNPEAHEASGRAEMQHHDSNGATPNTNTKKRNIKSNKSAGEKSGRSRREKPASDSFADVQITEVLKTLDPAEMQELQNFASEGPNMLWQGLQFLAVDRWHKRGGDHATCQALFAMLGEHPATVLLLLITDRAQTGEVRDLSRYAAACAVRARDGRFMWGAGVRAAAQRSAMRIAA